MNIINSPLLDHIFAGVSSDESGAEAAECLCTMLRETRDIDESQDAVHALYPRVVALKPQIEKAAEADDTDQLKALTKVFSTAAISWVVGVAREPSHFRPLVEAVLECAARDKERDVIEHTFDFWYELKQYLVLERYIQGRLELVDIFSKLVDILLRHLEYPRPESGNESDLFDGDREQEEKFREFRHRMGDTLKDSCDVMGVTECLTKVLHAIKLWTQKYAGQVNGSDVPHWQELEAPLFAMRALGRMVHKDESIVLPQLMPLLVQIPSHEKLRFATIMVLGRYTEWTAAHPEYLEPQFNYIVESFQTESREILRAAALSLKFFCTDCRNLLSGQVLQLQTFYDQILDKLPDLSKEEITEGVANVVAVQPVDETYRLLKTYADPLVQRLMAKANNASNEEGKLALAEGCFLWVTSAILREFSEDREHLDQATTENIYTFFEAQTTAFLRVMADLQPKDLPDVIDDFFRLLIDALLYYPQKLIPSQLLVPIFQASVYALTLEQRDPLSSTLHFLRDLLSYGGDNPASSEGLPEAQAAEIRGIIKNLLMAHGADLVKQTMAGMMITFPGDCFADGSGVVLALFEIMPAQTTEWVAHTIELLPQGTVSAPEAQRFVTKVKEKLSSGDVSGLRHVRTLLQDFTTNYRRRNVAPRDGLGQLEAARFQFSG
ncbi:hypothetical protein VCV18_000685 [Metarhizium anisopliae]